MIHFVIMAQDKIKMHDSSSHTTEKDENTELLKEKLLKVNSVLAAHQIALWEINVNTLECTFTQEYFESLGLDKVGICYQNLFCVVMFGLINVNILYYSFSTLYQMCNLRQSL